MQFTQQETFALLMHNPLILLYFVRCIDFNAKFPTFQINYWASFNKQRGIEMYLGKGSISAKHSLQVTDINDELIHRPRVSYRDVSRQRVYQF